MRYVRCGNSLCQEFIDTKAFPTRKYHSRACKQETYRKRKKKKAPVAKITFERYCVNCGKKFTTTRVRQQFHKESCRVSFWQQRKRLEALNVTDESED